MNDSHKQPYVVAIVQARMQSHRLPGKVLADIEGKPAILRMLNRVGHSQKIDELWLATSTETADDVLADVVRNAGYKVFRGDHFNVLDRYYRIALQRNADVVVRLTGDCPLHDPAVIDFCIETFLNADSQIVYASNSITPAYPDGLDVEIMRFDALEHAAYHCTDALGREHVGMAIHQRHLPDVNPKPRTISVPAPAKFDHLRFTLDTPDDLAFIRCVYRKLLPDNRKFTWMDVVALLTRCPWLIALNLQPCRDEAVSELAKNRNIEIHQPCEEEI